jgi:hypothetical protein
MAEVSVNSRVVQIGAETTPGTAVPALKRLRSLSITPSPQVEVELFRAAGSRFDSVQAVSKEWMSAQISGKAVYDELPYLFASLLKKGAPTSLGGSPAAFRWLWKPSLTDEDDSQTYTVEVGSKVRAQRFSYGFIPEGGLTISRAGVEVSGTMLGQAMVDDIQMSTNEVQRVAITGSPTGGTFRLTFDGQTTAGIAYNANAAAVQAALEALPNITPGDVLCTGGTLPGTPVDVEFRGQYRQTNVPAMTADGTGLTGGSSPTVTVTTVTAGVTPATIDLVPVLAKTTDIFVDDTFAGIGTTKLLRCLQYDLKVGNRRTVFWPLNSAAPSFGGDVEDSASWTITLKHAADAQGMALLGKLRAGTTFYVRCRATGGVISGTNAYRLTIDAAVKVAKAPNPGEADKLYTYDWELVPVDDPNGALSVEIINTLAAV